MEGKNKKSRKSSGSNSVVVGIIAFFLGFLFAFIVLIGSIFGVGYVAATTDINEVFRVLGLENENQNATGDDDKYNYINADAAPNILKLVQEVMAMANSGLGEISIDKIDYLAPVTDTVLDMAYGYIDEVVDFDKEAFRKVSLTSVLDTLTTSVYYIRTAKIVDLLNDKMGYNINLDDIPVVPNLIKGVEAQYATVEGTNLKLPVLFDYYVNDGEGNYNRISPVVIDSYPSGLSQDYLTETMGKDEDGNTLYKVYYVPCKVSGTSITEAEYIAKPLTQTNENVYYTDDNGQKQYLHYTFRTIEYGSDTAFIAVKPQMVDGAETFVIEPNAIDEYYEPYARNYNEGVAKRSENNAMYGVKTINGINYFKDSQGNVIDYDPLTVSDIMLNPGETLNNVYLSDLLTQFAGEGNTDMINEVLAGISLGNVLNGHVDFDEVIQSIKISTFLNEVQPDDTIMTYIVYNITDVENNGGVYTATYDKGGENEKAVTLNVVNGVIKSMKDSANNAVYGNTVKDLNTITDGLTLDIFLDVKADDAIMTYIGYGIEGAVEVTGENWQYEGTVGEGINAKTVRIYTDNNGYVTKVTDTNGNTVKGTTINEVSDRVNGIMDVLTLPDVIDVDPSNVIMAYIGYGLTDVEEVSGKAYKYTGTCDDTPVYIYVDSSNNVTKVTKQDGTLIKGTSINGVSAKIDGIMDVITIPDFIDIDPEEPIMAYIGYGLYDVTAQTGTDNGKAYTHVAKYKDNGTEVTVYICTKTEGTDTIIDSVWKADGEELKGIKANEVSSLVENVDQALRISDFIDIEADNAIMAYIGYGVYNVAAEAGTDVNTGKAYTHTGTIDVPGDPDPINVNVYIATDANMITAIWREDNGQAVDGTKICDMSEKMDNLYNKLKIRELITISSDSLILNAIKDSTVNGLEARINSLTIGEIIEIGDDTPAILKALQNTTIDGLSDRVNTMKIGEIVAIDSTSSKILQALADTTINGIDARINELKIGDIVEIDGSSSKILQALADTTINGIDAKINELKIGDIVAIDSSSSKILQALADTTINGIDAKINELKIGDIVAIDSSSSKILQALADTTINGIDARINELKIGDIVEIDNSSSKILKALKNTSINELDTTIKGLTVSDVLEQSDIDNNAILSELKDKNIFELSTEIDKVLIQRIYSDQVYGTGATLKNNTEIAYSSEYLYYTRSGNETEGYTYEIVKPTGLEEGTIAYDNALGKITLEQFNTGNYYTYGEAHGMWKLVLYRVQSDGTKTEKAYTLNNFDYMVDSCSDVVYNSTLNELKDAEIIESTVNLDKTIKTVDTENPYNPLTGTVNYKYVTVNGSGNVDLTSDSSQAKKIGELSLKQLLSAITMYL